MFSGFDDLFEVEKSIERKKSEIQELMGNKCFTECMCYLCHKKRKDILRCICYFCNKPENMVLPMEVDNRGDFVLQVSITGDINGFTSLLKEVWNKHRGDEGYFFYKIFAGDAVFETEENESVVSICILRSTLRTLLPSCIYLVSEGQSKRLVSLKKAIIFKGNIEYTEISDEGEDEFQITSWSHDLGRTAVKIPEISHRRLTFRGDAIFFENFDPGYTIQRLVSDDLYDVYDEGKDFTSREGFLYDESKEKLEKLLKSIKENHPTEFSEVEEYLKEKLQTENFGETSDIYKYFTFWEGKLRDIRTNGL